MILVISNIADEAAPVLVDMFPPGAASLITASDLHESFKAAISVDDFESAGLTINQLKIPVREIRGVVTAISHFLPQEFYYLAAADREYVCAETNAFFIYFLSRLACKKLNPPSVKTLTGLGVHVIELSKAARQLGIPVWPFQFKNGTPANLETAPEYQYVKSTLIGNALLGDETPEKISGYMRRMAGAFSLPYLSCSFLSRDGKDYVLADIQSVADLTPLENREAIVNYFKGETL